MVGIHGLVVFFSMSGQVDRTATIKKSTRGVVYISDVMEIGNLLQSYVRK